MSVWEEMQARNAERTETIRRAIGDQAEAIAAAQDFGIASAVRRGRTSRLPYVPVVTFGTGRTQQVRGLAYATREEAVDRARRQIKAWRRQLVEDLCKPNHRTLREQYGLPREIAQTGGQQ